MSQLDARDVLVTASNVSVGYDERIILKDVSLEVLSRQIHVVLGSSGCGKSTLLRVLFGALSPSSGDVQLLGTPIHHASGQDRAEALSQVGVLFQNGALINGLTVLENVSLPIEERALLPSALAHEIAQSKLQTVGLVGHEHRYPRELSGGMRKRAALARALANDPALLFCDEPGAGLDPISLAELDALLLRLRDEAGLAIVVVTHELASIRRIADQVTMLHEGHVLASGTLAEVQSTAHPMISAFFHGRRREEDSLRSLWHDLTLDVEDER